MQHCPATTSPLKSVVVSSVEQSTTSPVLPSKKAVDWKGIGASGGDGAEASALPRMSHASTKSSTRWAGAVRGMAATRDVVRTHGGNCRRLGG